MSKIEHPKLGLEEFPHIDGASAAAPKREPTGRPRLALISTRTVETTATCPGRTCSR